MRSDSSDDSCSTLMSSDLSPFGAGTSKPAVRACLPVDSGGMDDTDEQHVKRVMTPPIPIPTVSDGHGHEILPASADVRDREREEGDEPPDKEDSKIDCNKDSERQTTPDVFDRFSPARKRTILAIVSYSAFISRT